MSKNDLKLLDCTLRDGGYINEWAWGNQRAKDIIYALVKANVEMVEVGFLRNVKEYNEDIMKCNYIEELNQILPSDKKNTMFVGMILTGSYDVSKLSPYSGEGIELIRVTAHDYDIDEGMKLAKEIKNKGYKVSINPINIMGYSDDKLLSILEQVNEIQPYQFSIVDTFGSMKRRDLDRIVSLVDNNLDKNIRVGLHLHENMSLSCSLAQSFFDKHLNRSIVIDASLMGMGRNPGNLPIELIADYLNDTAGKAYDIDYLMDAIQDYVAPIKGDCKWGYTPAYFLSARFNLHRNYAEHYLKKGDLTNRDINHLLSRIDKDKKSAFDSEYADCLYNDYMNNIIEDDASRKQLYDELNEKKILVIAPGNSINLYRKEICDFIIKESPIIISVNFLPDLYKADYAFFSNNKRFSKLDSIQCKIIATSNLIEKQADYTINYNSLTGSFNQGCNSFIMLLKLLKDMEVNCITVVGADGYSKDKLNYYSSSMRSYVEHDNKFNIAVGEAIQNLGVPVKFLTPSAYEI